VLAPCSVPPLSSIPGVGGHISLSILQSLLRGVPSVYLACPLDSSTIPFGCCERTGIFFVIAELGDKELRYRDRSLLDIMVENISSDTHWTKNRMAIVIL
jgi:hypothetical protein